jgi:CHAT domain-containing protein/tetratricopeptide (TPR) repeat protein
MINRVLFGVLLVAASACRAPPDAAHEAGLAPPPPTALMRADSLYAAGAFADARAIWQVALDAARARQDPVAEADLLTSIGLASRRLGDWDASRSAGEAALALKLRLDLREALFRSYNGLGLLAWDEGRLDDAIALYDQATAAAQAVGDSLGVAKAANNRALIHKDRGEPLLARAGFEALRDMSRQLADTVLLASALDNLAMIDLQLGDPLSALASAEEARALARASGDAEAEENALGQLATAYHALGEPQRAFAAIDSALAIAEASGLRRRVAEDLKLLGDYYASAGDHRRALEHYQRAQRINLELALPEDQGNTLRDEAQSYRALGHPDTALARATRALALHQAGAFRAAELEDQLVLAQLAGDRGDASGATQALSAAGRIGRLIGTPVASAEVALGSARMYDQAARPVEVLAALEGAEAGLALLGVGQRWEPEALRARAYARLGRWDAAESAGRQAVASVERVRAGYGSGALRTAFLSARARVYADLVVTLLAQGRQDEAFEVADGARGRALLEHLTAARRDVERLEGSARDVLAAERLLRRIDNLTGQLQAIGSIPPRERGASTGATTRSLEERLAGARSEYEGLLNRLAVGSSRPALLLGAATPGAAPIRRSLRRDEVLVEYLILADRLLIFAITPAAVQVREVQVEAEALAARVRLARELAGVPGPYAASDAVFRGLHDILIAPIGDLLQDETVRRLLLVPSGPLAYLPFAALRDGRDEPLVVRYSLLALPSAASLVALRREDSQPAARRESGVAFAPLPSGLPASRQEARDVRDALRGRAVIGAAATEKAVRDALSSGGVVHLATHGILNPDNPMFSRLELAPGPRRSPDDDGRLEVHELLGLRIGADLVYLSGCETGKGASWRTGFDRGEDYTTLAQAFLVAGARNVVATLWRVDDPGAAAFARAFYGAWNGGDPAEALAVAQRTLLREPGYQSPYYWAAYQVTVTGGSTSPEAIASRSRP